MTVLRSVCLGGSLILCLGGSWVQRAQGQMLQNPIADRLTHLDRAVCLRQWQQAIDITGELVASPGISATYRQNLLDFRRQLQAWQVNPASLTTQTSCDRTQALFLTLAQPAEPEPQPLDWNRALATLRSTRPIIDLDDDFDPTTEMIPAELVANSPEVLTDAARPIDTTDGFNVVGGRVNGGAQVYSFLARLGDRVSLDVDVTRVYVDGEPQLFFFDQGGRLLTQNDRFEAQVSVSEVEIPQTDVYFAVVSPQGVQPIMDAQGVIVGWQPTDNSSFDYTLTLTGVTSSQALLP